MGASHDPSHRSPLISGTPKELVNLFILKTIYFDCAWSSLLCEGFLQLQRVGSVSICRAQTSQLVASLVVEHRL